MPTIDERYIDLCLELAKDGFPHTSPNPLVGSVIVKNGDIIGQGFHQKYGSHHAEIEALNSVKDKELLDQATLYVNLEPCSHYGQTPPCAKAIIETKIKKVVIGAGDPNPQVSGKGIEILRSAGIEVVVGVLSEKCIELNKRFYTAQKLKRPYVILKWAETKDGFIAREDYSSKWISSEESRKLVHKWRSEEQAILVGTNTVMQDNPNLTVRNIKGKNPVRVVIDREMKIPKNFHLYNNQAETIFFTSKKNYISGNISIVKIDFNQDTLKQIFDYLLSVGIISLFVEGGSITLSEFISMGYWDELRVFKSNNNFSKGISAPDIGGLKFFQERERFIDTDVLSYYRKIVNWNSTD